MNIFVDDRPLKTAQKALDEAGKQRRKLQLQLEQTDEPAANQKLALEIEAMNHQVSELLKKFNHELDTYEELQAAARKERNAAEQQHKLEAAHALHALEAKWAKADKEKEAREAEREAKRKQAAVDEAKREEVRRLKQELAMARMEAEIKRLRAEK